VEEAMADDLPHRLLGPPRGSLGTPLTIHQADGPYLEVGGAKLVIALPRVAKLGRRGTGAEFVDLAFDEHEELEDRHIIGSHGQGAARTNDLEGT
jgi:hypothetical protein